MGVGKWGKIIYYGDRAGSRPGEGGWRGEGGVLMASSFMVMGIS